MLHAKWCGICCRDGSAGRICFSWGGWGRERLLRKGQPYRLSCRPAVVLLWRGGASPRLVTINSTITSTAVCSPAHDARSLVAALLFADQNLLAPNLTAVAQGGSSLCLVACLLAPPRAVLLYAALRLGGLDLLLFADGLEDSSQDSGLGYLAPLRRLWVQREPARQVPGGLDRRWDMGRRRGGRAGAPPEVV